MREREVADFANVRRDNDFFKFVARFKRSGVDAFETVGKNERFEFKVVRFGEENFERLDGTSGDFGGDFERRRVVIGRVERDDLERTVGAEGNGETGFEGARHAEAFSEKRKKRREKERRKKRRDALNAATSRA